MKVAFQLCIAMYLNYFVVSYRHHGFNNGPKRFSGGIFPRSKDYVDHGKMQRKPIRGANELLNSYFKIGAFAVPYGAGSQELHPRDLKQALLQAPIPRSEPVANIQKLSWVEKPGESHQKVKKFSWDEKHYENPHATWNAMPSSPAPIVKEANRFIGLLRTVKRPVLIIGPVRKPMSRTSEDLALAAVLRLVIDPTDAPYIHV